MKIILKYLLLISFTSWTLAGFSQDPTEFQIALIEAFVEESDEGISYDELFQHLEDYLKNPLSLNEASEDDLYALALLTDTQIRDFLAYRDKNGALLSIYELQAIRGFDIKTIQRILSFVTVQLQQVIQLQQGTSRLLLRWSQHLEKAKGYQNGAYLGASDNLYLRYRYEVPRSFSLNFTAEKDAGEPFFKGKNSSGFDFYSGHMAFENLNKYLKKVIVGDFSIQFGQGLLISNGFATSKSALVNNIRKGGPSLKPYRSKGEVEFQRGAAIQIQPVTNIELTAFFSTRNRDASFLKQDSTEEELLIRSIQTSGIHRTASELASKNAVKFRTIGGRIQYHKNRVRIGLNVLSDVLDQAVGKKGELYQQFLNSKRRLLSVGMDYNWQVRNFLLFGEFSGNIHGPIAQIHGLLIGLGKNVDMSLSFRSYPKDYFSYHANPFGETKAVYNENGLYFGLEYRPTTGLAFSTYLDVFRHPWLRFRVDRPSKGDEFLVRISYEKRKRYETYLQLKLENKFQNEVGSQFDAVVPVFRRQIRWQLSYTLSKGFEWRNRIEYSYYEKTNRAENGFLVYQDLIFAPLQSSFSLKARIAYFDTPSYDSRIYMYENDVTYAFRIPPYYYQGFRYYLYIRYKGIRNLNLESRYAILKYTKRVNVGSGNDLITGPMRSTISFQLRYSF